VIASSGPVGRMPTFSPTSEARGRAFGVGFCEAAAALTSKTAMAARSIFVISRIIAAAYGCHSMPSGSDDIKHVDSTQRMSRWQSRMVEIVLWIGVIRMEDFLLGHHAYGDAGLGRIVRNLSA
jgi:hypothetical protein